MGIVGYGWVGGRGCIACLRRVTKGGRVSAFFRRKGRAGTPFSARMRKKILTNWVI
jgi:hypothetical protein